jgi:hypothetical protein
VITSRASSSQKRGPSPAAPGATAGADAGVDVGTARGAGSAGASGFVALCLWAAGLALWRWCAVFEGVRRGVAVAVEVREGVVEARVEVWTAERLEVVCVLGEEVLLCVPDEDALVCLRVGDWAGGRLSVYWSAMGTLPDGLAVEVEVVGVAVVPVVVVADVVVAEVVDVEAVVGVAALAAAAGTANPIVATRTPTTESRWRDRLQMESNWFTSLGNLAACAGPSAGES